MKIKKIKRESELTRSVFEKALEYIQDALDSGVIDNQKTIDLAMKAFNGHIKVRNLEVRENALRFNIWRNTSPNAKELKKIVRKSLSEYSRRPQA